MAKKKRNEDKDMTKDFFEALDILEKERSISKEYLLKKIKDALATAYKKETLIWVSIKVLILFHLKYPQEINWWHPAHLLFPH